MGSQPQSNRDPAQSAQIRVADLPVPTVQLGGACQLTWALATGGIRNLSVNVAGASAVSLQ